MRVNWKHLAIALAVLPFAAVFAAWIGFFNVGASTGHWRITEWFLHLAMRSAVRTYALSVEVPERLPTEGLQPAAGHFARGCAMCHGAPGEPRPPAVELMLPQPPDLAANVGAWTDAELFRIVKHGIRFTGMPAWPTQDRDDEVWAMVVFLRALPGMDAAAYRGLAHGDGAAELHAGTFDEAVAECARCHGADGSGRAGVTPVIAGQKEHYLLASLEAYADGRRASGFMRSAAAATDRRLLPALARHFAAMPRPPGRPEEEAPTAAEGEAMARSGVAEDGIPACLGCHGSRNPAYPELARQPHRYLEQQLRLFRQGKRGGTAFSPLMTEAARKLSDRQIAALAAYFAGAAPAPATGAPEARFGIIDRQHRRNP